jgi:CRP/FNR family transcriptional regulator, cyclic AMP receptor protein
MSEGLKKVLYFLGLLDDRDVDWLVRAGVKRTVPSGTVIIREGEASPSLFFILKGEFSVTSAWSLHELARVGAGEILGEISLVDDRPPSATVTALAESVIGDIPIDALERQIAKDHAFGARFYKAIAVTLADRLRARQSGVAGDHEAEIEVAPHLLDIISMAGNRFADMQRRVWGA